MPCAAHAAESGGRAPLKSLLQQRPSLSSLGANGLLSGVLQLPSHSCCPGSMACVSSSERWFQHAVKFGGRALLKSSSLHLVPEVCCLVCSNSFLTPVVLAARCVHHLQKGGLRHAACPAESYSGAPCQSLLQQRPSTFSLGASGFTATSVLLSLIMSWQRDM